MSLRTFATDLLPQSAEERIMASATFINTFSNGLFSVTSAIYFTKVVGITPLQLGFAFSLAAGIGLAMTLPMGHLADRVSPKRLNIGLGAVSALGMGLYAVASSYGAFLAVAIVAAEALSSLFSKENYATLVSESLIIGGWVALWRPIEIFLYDWWPIRAEARLYDRMGEMEVRMHRAGAPHVAMAVGP